MKKITKGKILADSIITLAIIAMVITGILGAIYLSGGRINISKSIPLGLYRISSKPLAKGEYVIFCPPSKAVFREAKERGYIGSGFCPDHYGYMMKKIVAMKDDKVSITSQGVTVNSVLLQHSRPLAFDKMGRPLPQIDLQPYILNESELLLMTDHSASSFDARYFGILSKTQVISVLQPMITWTTS